MLAAHLQAAAEHALAGEAKSADLAWLLGCLLIGPWILGWLAGSLARVSTSRQIMRRLGLVSARATTAWDEVFGRSQRGYQVLFRDAGRSYIGFFAHADTEGRQLYLVHIYREGADASWVPVEGFTGALLLTESKEILWLNNLDASGQQIDE